MKWLCFAIAQNQTAWPSHIIAIIFEHFAIQYRFLNGFERYVFGISLFFGMKADLKLADPNVSFYLSDIHVNLMLAALLLSAR
jgi:hypothetical protein